MARRLAIVAALAILALVVTQTAEAAGRGSGGVIYVTTQGLYYDTFGAAQLPRHGRFQKLEMGPGGPYTMYGPGDPGYLGGRWWVDVNGNGMQDDGDSFFLCPLLGPGRSSP